MAKMSSTYDDEDQLCCKIKNEILCLLRNSSKLISNDDGIKITVFVRKCSDYPLLNDKKNKAKIEQVLQQMEKGGLLVVTETFIQITEKGKNIIY